MPLAILIALIVGAFAMYLARALWDACHTRNEARSERDHRNLVAAQNLRDHAGAVAIIERGKNNMGSVQVLEVWSATGRYARSLPRRQAEAFWQAIHERSGTARTVATNITNPTNQGACR
jgi:hypothetical protein